MGRLAGGSDGLEVDGNCAARCDAVALPRSRLANVTDLADAHALLNYGDAVADYAAGVELLDCLDVKGRVEAHLEMALRVLVEHSEIALLGD